MNFSKNSKIKNKKIITKLIIILAIIASTFLAIKIVDLNTSKTTQIISKIETSEIKEDLPANTIRCDSIVQGIKENNLPNGNYVLRVTGKYGTTTQTIDYPIELINFYDNVTYTANQSLGDTTTTKKMLVVKYHKNLTINSGVTVTATTVSNYCYKKGMYVCVMGDLFNNGIITMTARGTYEQAGENVFLWKNTNDTYEYVPAIGATGGTGVSGSYNYGNSGSARATGGGGSGGSGGTKPSPGGSGGTGTSYSGGAGGGGTYHAQKTGTYQGSSGSSTGGSGGYGATRGGDYVVYASGGTGNGPGSGSYGKANAYGNAGTMGLWGTGGLLVVFSNTLYNNGEITAKGSDNSSTRYSGESRHSGGGASGGGSVNVFANKIGLNKSTSAERGYFSYNSAGISYFIAGGGGGNGSATVTEVGPELKSKIKEIEMEIGDQYTINKSDLEIYNQKITPTGTVTLDNITFESLNTPIATIDSTGKINAVSLGKTKIKITEATTNITTYIYIVVKSGIIPDIKEGNNYTVALKKDGTVWSYGRNLYGELGVGTTTNSLVPIKVNNLENITKIEAGYNHSLALNANGEVFSWGRNLNGQLGIGDENNRTSPVKINGLSNIKKITAYKNISLALDSDGKVYAWGEGYSILPTRLNLADRIVDISGELLLTEGGNVINIKAITVKIAGLDKIAKISCGSDHYLGLKDDGTVYSWGDNSSGESAKNPSTTTPQAVAFDYYDISAGLNHSILLKQNGEVFVCGTNSSGQIGLNTVSSTAVLTKITGIPSIEKISAGSATHSSIIDTTGFVWTAGLNTYGELGLGNTTQYKVYTKLGQTVLFSSIEREYLNVGENRTLNVRLENTFNLKIDLIDGNQNNFNVVLSDSTKLSKDGNIITAIGFGTSYINITHTPTGSTKQVEIIVARKFDSIVQGIRDTDMPDGIYEIVVNGETYNLEVINQYEDVRYSLEGTQTTRNVGLGNTTPDQTMLVVKYHKNLTIDKGVTLTSAVRKKGMYICVLGNTYNNGSISMTARGASAQGQNVYLWKNINSSYEFVPEKGANGGTGISNSNGTNGSSGTNRQTGGGGSGSSAGTNPKPGGSGGSGTSYSGGAGGGGTYHTSGTGTYSGSNGSSTGGPGGYGGVRGSGYATYASGGSGNGAGSGAYSTVNNYANAGTYGQSGTGGLLIFYTDVLYNSGEINSKGSDNNSKRYSAELRHAGGGASGAGSVNIFAKYIGSYENINSTGGKATINKAGMKYVRPGSNGGDGSVTVNLLGSVLSYLDKNINIKLGNNYTLENNKLLITKLNTIQTENLTLGDIVYEIENEEIAEIVDGNIVPISEGITMLKITDTTNNLVTYSYINVTSGTESKVFTGSNHTITLKQNGTVWSFGQNTNGQLGDGTLVNKNIPVQVLKQDKTPLENIVDIYAIGNTNICLDSTGNIYTWGYVKHGSSSQNQIFATKYEGITNIEKVTIFNNNFIVLNSNGEVFIFGEGYSTPSKILTNESISEISGNKMLSNSGKVYDISTPNTQINYLENIAKISAGKDHIMALTTNGELYTVGTNTKGQLGNGTNISSSIPVLVKDANGNYLENVIDISAGAQCSMATTIDGKVYVWGDNVNKKLGITASSVNVATQIIKVQDKIGTVLELPKISKVSAGLNSSALVDENGFVYTVGLGTLGQLGTEDNISRTSYTKIGNVEVITIPDNLKVKIGDTKEILIIISNSFNLKTDIVESDGLIVNNTNERLASVTKKDGVDNSGILDKTKMVPNYLVEGIKIGRVVLAVSDQTNQYSKNVYVDIVGSYTAETSANVENGDGFTIALKEDGTVWSFGKNTIGQLGNGNTNNLNVPNKIIMPEIIKTISVGKNHTLAQGKSGKVYSWGLNSNGQLGFGNTTNKKVPSEITGLANIVKIKSVGNTSFAINSTGKIYAWGEGYTKIPAIISINANVIDLGKTYYLADDGKVRTIKNNTEIQLCLRQNPNPEIVEIENEKIVQISEGTDHLLLLSESGKVYSYGINVYGQLGDGSLVGKTENISTAVKTGMWTLLENIVDISAGENYSMALAADGNIYTWGINGNLQLGHEGIQENAFAIVQPNINDVIAVRAGALHSSVITNPGNVYTFGNGENGELGNGSNDNYAIPQLVGKNIIETNKNNIILEVGETFDIDGTINYFNLYEEKVANMEYESKDSGRILANPITGEIIGLKEGRTTVIAKEVGTEKIGVIQVRILETGSKPEGTLINIEPKIVTGGKHTLSLKVDGTVWAYGQNTYGQLGIGTQETTDNPIKVEFGTGVKIVDIACGEEHSMALDSAGNVYVWGRNNYFQLGNSTDIFVSLPKKIESIANATKIAAGNSNSFVITQDKNAYSWGLNANGECGIGSYTNKITVTKAKFLSDVIDIKPGKNHTIALKSTGEVFATGSNLYGELGFGEQETRKINTFRKINLLSNVVEIGTGDSHSLALNKDGKLFTWGSNIYGNLGNGQSQTQSNMPLEITGIQNIRYVTAGKGYSLLIDSANNVYVSGLNNLGQLGDGTKTDKTTFVKLTSINNVINVSGGCGYTNFVKKDGTVWATGDYNQGDESLISKTKGIIPKRVGNSESGFENNEITIKINETKDIKNQFIHEFNLINVEAEVETILEYNSLNTMIATITAAKMIHGEKIGKTWVRINNTQDNKVYIIKVNVIDENYNVAPQVASGENFAAVLKADGTIWSYGYNSNGQLGDGTNITSDIPNRTNVLLTYRNISAGKNFITALRNDNTVWVSGDNSFGQLGQGNTLSRNKLVQVLELKNIKKVAAGDRHVIAIDRYGIVYGWGKNSNGQLGDLNINKNTNLPVIIGSINERVIDIEAGENQSILVTADGKIYGYGEQLNGYLTQVSNVYQVEVCKGYLLILDKQGNLYKYSNGNTSLVQSTNNIIDISAIQNTNMLQTLEEKVYVWGNNSYGQLGVNSLENQVIPLEPAENNNNIFGIGAGYNNTYLIDNTGSIYAAGNNEYGSLGNSSRINSIVHTLVGNRKFDIMPKNKMMTVNDIETIDLQTDTFNAFNRSTKFASEYEWSSLNEEIVSVEEGVLTANSEGETTITAIDKITGEIQTAQRFVVAIEKQRIQEISVDNNMADVSGEMSYNLRLATKEQTGTLKIITNDPTDQISLDGQDFTNAGIGQLIQTIDLTDKIAQIPVFIKITNGTVLEYTLNVEKVSDDTSIEKIIVNGQQAVPVSLSKYEIVVEEDVQICSSNVIAKDTNSYVSIDGNEFELGTQTKDILLETSLIKTVPITVKSESGLIQEYTLVIYRKSEVTELEKLTVNGIDATRVSETKYVSVINSSLNETEVFAKTLSMLVDININNSEYQLGEITQSINTVNDVTIISINVKINEEEIKQYTLEIYKKDSSKLDILMVNGEVVFAEGNVYEAFLPSSETQATIRAIASDKNNFVQIESNDMELTESEAVVEISEIKNQYSIKVIDGASQETEYTLIIKKQEQDTSLESIGILNGIYEKNIDILDNQNIFEIKVPNSFTNFDVVATTKYINSKVKINEGLYNKNISVENVVLTGETTEVSIIVQAQDPLYTEEYTLKITKMSSNTDLESITINSSEAVLKPDGTYYYKLEDSLDNVNIIATSVDEKSNISINISDYQLKNCTSNVIIDSKTTKVDIMVKAEDGSTKTYELIIESLEDNANILKVEVNGVQANYRDGENIYETRSQETIYSVHVELEDPMAKIQLGNDEEKIGVAETVITKSGLDTILIINVTSQNGLVKETYELIITEKSNNAQINTLEVNGILLNPDIQGNYKTEVAHNITDIDIAGTTEDLKAVIKIDGTTNNSNYLIVTREISETITIYEIEVIAEDGTTQIVTLEVKKLDGNTNISQINVGTTQENMMPAVLKPDGSYYIKSIRSDSIYIQAISESINGKVKIHENEEFIQNAISMVNLENEVNNFSILVTAEDGTIENHNLVIEKVSNDSTIKSVEGLNIIKTEIEEYQINVFVPEELTQIDLRTVTNNSFAIQKLDSDLVYSLNTMDKTISLSGYTEDGISINLEVLAEDGITQSLYTISIYKEANLNISEILVNTEIPNYSLETGIYSSVVNATGTISVVLKSQNPLQKVSILNIDGVTVIATGTGTATANITQTEQTKDYILKIESYTGLGSEESVLNIRKKSQDATISYIKVDGLGTIKQSVTNYTASVSGKNTYPIEVKLRDEFARAKIDNGLYSDSSTLLSEISVADGATKSFNITVKTENGEELVYQLDVTRISSNTDIQEITVTDNEVVEVDGEFINNTIIRPVVNYNEDTKTYKIIVDKNLTSSTIKVTSVSAFTTIKLDNTITGVKIAQIDKTLNGIGSTKIPINIIAADATEETRYLEIVQLSDDIAIEVFEIDGFVITPDVSGDFTTTITDKFSEFALRIKTVNPLSGISLYDDEEIVLGELLRNIEIGSNRKIIVPVKITAEDNTFYIYNLTINIISSNSSVKNVYVDEIAANNLGSIYEAFISPESEQVTIRIEADVPYSKVKYGETESNGSMQFVYNTSDLLTQQFTIPYQIIAENGEIQDYELRLIRKSTNNNIQELSINNELLSLDENGEYYYRILENNQNVNVKLVSENIYAIVEIQGEQSINLIEKQIDITAPEKIIEVPIKVISQSGLERTSVINIEKISDNRQISSLKIEDEEIEKIEGIYKHYIYETRNSVVLKVTSQNQYAKIEVFDENNNLLKQDTSYLEIELTTVAQINNFYLRITAETGDFEENQIVVEKMSVDTSLKELYVNGVLVELNAQNKYEVKVPDTNPSILVKAITNNENAYVRIMLGSENLVTTEENIVLSPDKNMVIPITVRSQSGIAKVTYLYVERISTSTNINMVKVNDKDANYEPLNTRYIALVDRFTIEPEVFVMEKVIIQILKYDNNDYQASLRIKVAMPLTEQGKTVEVTVVSEIGTEKTYTIDIIRESDDTSLEYVKVNGVIVQLQEGSTDSYLCMVPQDDETALIEVKTNPIYSQLRIGDSEVKRNISQTSVLINTQEEITIVPVVVRAPDGLTVKTYNIVLYRGDNNTNISIKVNGSIVEKNEQGQYIKKVKGGTNSVDVIINSESLEATIVFEDITRQGLVEKNVDLINENNNFIVNITAPDGTQKQYDLIIIKTTNIDGRIITENISNIHKADVYVYKTQDTREEEETYYSPEGEIIIKEIPELGYREILTQIETKEEGFIEIELAEGGQYDLVIRKKGYLDYRIMRISIAGGDLVVLEDCILLAGDVIKSGQIEIKDLVAMNKNFGTTLTENNMEEKSIYDLNEDGIVNKLDRDILIKNYGLISVIRNWVDPNIGDTVIDYILTPPTLTIYEYGQELDLKGATIKPIMYSGISVPKVPVIMEMISGYNKNVLGLQTVYVTYQGIIKEFVVRVKDNIQAIQIQSVPNKTTYKFGEQINLDGAKLNTISSSGIIEQISITNSMITGYSAVTLGQQTITVTYNGKITSFIINVEDYIKDIQLINPNKTSYYLGDAIDLTGGKVKTIMASGLSGTEIDMTIDMITEFNTESEGAKQVLVTYQGFTKMFSITVSNPLLGISIQKPVKKDYLYGEELDLTGGTIIVNMETGDVIGPIPIIPEMISGYNKNILGVQTITVSYLGMMNSFNINVSDWDKELVITSMPKTEYDYDEKLNVENGKVAIMTASGVISSNMPEAKPVSITAGMVAGYDSHIEGEQVLTISWGGFTVNYSINLINSIKSIYMYTLPEVTEIYYGENINLDGVTIKVIKINSEYIVDVTETMISGFDNTKLGEQAVTVSYGGKTTNFLIIVKQKPVEPETTEIIELETPNTTEGTITENTNFNFGPVSNSNEENIVENVNQEEEIVNPETSTNENPAVTLGSKDKKEFTVQEKSLLGIAGISLLSLSAGLIVSKRKNTEIFIYSNGTKEYTGKARLDIKNAEINISKNLEEPKLTEKSFEKVELVFNEKIGEKMIDKELNIKFGQNSVKTKITKEENKYIANI